jgi:hypothetical protein
MSLAALAQQITTIAARGETTPVVVTPTYLSLRSRFVAGLACELIRQDAVRSVQIDWCCGHRRTLHRHWLRRQAKRSRSLLGQSMLEARGSCDVHRQASIAITSVIARPPAEQGKLVVGLCNDQLELPRWTTAIRLGFGVTRPGGEVAA